MNGLDRGCRARAGWSTVYAITEVTYGRKPVRFTVKSFFSVWKSGQNALDVHVQQQIQQDGERQQADGDQGYKVHFAADCLKVFK